MVRIISGEKHSIGRGRRSWFNLKLYNRKSLQYTLQSTTWCEVRNTSGATLEVPSGTTVLQSLLLQKRWHNFGGLDRYIVFWALFSRSLQREAGHAMESAQKWPQVMISVKFGAKHPSLRSPGGTFAPQNKPWSQPKCTFKKCLWSNY